MGNIFLTETANWLRAAGVHVVEFDGWQTRARSSGGYEPGRPWCVMWHHTASSTSPANDCHYMCHGADARPVANVLIARDGACWVMAAGATNTNGKGRSMQFSRGTVPADSMNSYAFGMEIANSGTGEDYPQAQVDAAFKVSATINARLGNKPNDVCTHQHYAPDRKIDPAMGGNNVQGSWHPRECTNAGSWNVDDLRAECQRRGGLVPLPPTTQPPDQQEDENMFDGIWKRENHDACYACYKDGTKQWLMDLGYIQGVQNLQRMRGATEEMVNVRTMDDPGLFAAMGYIIGPRPDGVDEWGNS